MKELPGVPLTWEKERASASAIANIAIEDFTPGEFARTFCDRYRIFTVAIDTESVKGIRVTPRLYTTLRDLDALVGAVKELSS